MKQPVPSFLVLALASFLCVPRPTGAAEHQEAKTPPPVEADAGVGKKLFRTHCAVCHFADATITKVGPGMKGLFQQKKLSLSGLPATEENIRKSIRDGAGDPKMPRMPPYRDVLTQKELDDLIAYLKTL